VLFSQADSQGRRKQGLNQRNDCLGYLRLTYRLPLILLHLLIGTPVTVLCQTRPGWAIKVGQRPLSQAVSHLLDFWPAAAGQWRIHTGA
jgi:hypothetical protein